jgi:hypothetical protein
MRIKYDELSLVFIKYSDIFFLFFIWETLLSFELDCSDADSLTSEFAEVTIF